jgi:outer membrane protein OmpU
LPQSPVIKITERRDTDGALKRIETAMMKNLLLAGVAAVAVAATAGAASAQSKFEVRMGGDAIFMAGFVNQDRDAGLRSSEFENRFRLNITATAKADNGLEYGARLRIRNMAGSTTDADRAYVFVGGGFGQVRLGTQAGASDEFGVIGPVVDWGGGILGGYDGFWADFLAGSSTASNLPSSISTGSLRTYGSSNAASRITYTTPEFSGLKLAASYTTNANSSGFHVARAKNDGSVQDLYEIGAIYSREFSGVTVDGSVFYSGGEISTVGVEDVSSWAAGLQLGYNGFKFGGFYSNHGDTGYTKADRFKDDQQAWGLSGSYETGPVTLGLAYSNHKDAGSTTVRGDRELNLYQAAINYAVAPGLTAGFEYSHFDLDTDSVTTRDKGDIFVLQTVLVF